MAKIVITFEAESIADLKLQIQEYSLCHLGLDFKAMAGQMVPPPIKDGKRLNDGSVRLHNPNYPGPHLNVPPPIKRKPGRAMGWRKIKPPPEEPAPLPLASPPVSDPPGESGGGPTIDETLSMAKDGRAMAKDAIIRLNEARGIEMAKEALAKFGAKHINDLLVEKYPELIAYCEELTKTEGVKND